MAPSASLLARRLKSKERTGAGGVLSCTGKGAGSASPQGLSPASFRAPPPPGKDAVVNTGGGISVMLNCKMVRLGSVKVLCVLPDGQLGIKKGGKAYPIGKPSQWRLGLDGPKFVMKDGICILDVGKGYLSLETGEMHVKPGERSPGGGGTFKVELRRNDPFKGAGVEIPPDPPDVSKRRYLRA